MKPFGKCLSDLGYVGVAESGDKPKQKDVKSVDKRNAMREICLNCTKKRCSGHCDKFPW